MKDYVTTIKVELYKPSARKRAVLQEAFKNYSEAFSFLEHEVNQNKWLYEQLEGEFRGSAFSRLLLKEYGQRLKSFEVEPFIDSLVLDFSIYWERKRSMLKASAKGGPPTGKKSIYAGKSRSQLLDAMVLEKGNGKKLLKRLEQMDEENVGKSIYFCRNDRVRNFCILYDPRNQRYFAKLYLLNGRSPYKKRITPSGGRVLYSITNGKELFVDGSSPKSYVIFPLSFGDYQRKQLKEAWEHPEIVRTGRLIEKNGKYELAISLKRPCPQAFEPKTYMGVSRGLDSMVHCSIVSMTGELIAAEGITLEVHSRKQRESGELLHKLCNKLISLAKIHQAQILLEHLPQGDRLLLSVLEETKQTLPILDAFEYTQAARFLISKAERSGVPLPIEVSSYNIFFSCPSCGSKTKENRFSERLLICTSCGMVMDIDKAGSLNLAKKLFQYQRDKLIFKVVNVQNSVEFVNDELEFKLRPENPFDCAEEFRAALRSHIENFIGRYNEEKTKPGFKKKLSMIKKLEKSDDPLSMIELRP